MAIKGKTKQQHLTARKQVINKHNDLKYDYQEQ